MPAPIRLAIVLFAIPSRIGNYCRFVLIVVLHATLLHLATRKIHFAKSHVATDNMQQTKELSVLIKASSIFISSFLSVSSENILQGKETNFKGIKQTSNSILLLSQITNSVLRSDFILM